MGKSTIFVPLIREETLITRVKPQITKAEPQIFPGQLVKRSIEPSFIEMQKEIEGLGEAAPGVDALKRTVKEPERTLIKKNNPLFLEIKKVYVGNLGMDKASLLVTSNVKSHETHDAAPKAIHMFRPSINNRSTISPSADDCASPIIYYSPAVLSDPIFTFDIVIEKKGEKVLKEMGKIINTAKDVPLFAPAKTFLVIGSMVVNIIDDLSDFIWSNNPKLHFDCPIDLDEMEKEKPMLSAMLIRNEEDADYFSDRYVVKFGSLGQGIFGWRLMDKKTNKEYDGEKPCMIVEVETSLDEGLKDYSSKLATAAQLQSFFNQKEESATISDVFGKAINLYNDASYYREITQEKKKLNGNLSVEEKRKIEERIEAYKKNMQTDDFTNLVEE